MNEFDTASAEDWMLHHAKQAEEWSAGHKSFHNMYHTGSEDWQHESAMCAVADAAEVFKHAALATMYGSLIGLGVVLPPLPQPSGST